MTEQMWGFGCLQPPIGKLQKQRLVRKERGLHSKATQPGWVADSCLKAHHLQNPKENPATLRQTSPRLCSEFFLPFKIPSFGGSYMIMQAAWLVPGCSGLLASSWGLTCGVGHHRCSSDFQGYKVSQMHWLTCL